jgi:hypothetical protein
LKTVVKCSRNEGQVERSCCASGVGVKLASPATTCDFASSALWEGTIKLNAFHLEKKKQNL